MKHAELGKNFKVFLTEDEMDRLKSLLSKTGGKMAPFARVLVLREIERLEGEEAK